MKGFVAVLSLVLLALVCNSGALHVPAAGVAAAQECCVRIRTTPLFSNSMTETLSGKKKDSDITGIIGEIPDVACRDRRIGKGDASSVHICGNGPFSPNFTVGISFAACNNLTYCCTLVHDSSRSPN